MDKQTLNVISQLVAEDAIPKAKKGEDLDKYVQRAYPKFEEAVSKSDNSIISEIEKDSEDPLKNAVSKLEVRRMLVKRFCQVNDPFDIEPPKEATTSDILEFNGVKGSEKELKDIMGKEAFEDYINRLKTPKKDGLTQTEIKQKREQHYAKYEPAFPSEKRYSHNTGGTTRGYHWQSDLQDAFLQDHVDFLLHFDLEDSFPVIEEEEPEQPAETVEEGKSESGEGANEEQE